jgi:hypothetical protein
VKPPNRCHLLGWRLQGLLLPTWKNPKQESTRLAKSIRRGIDNIHPSPGAIEFHHAFDQRKQGEIFALSHALAGVKFIAHLPDNNVPCDDRFTGISLYAAALPGGIATIAAGTLTLLMCHDSTDDLGRVL